LHIPAGKVLIAYATKCGVTKEYADIIASVLREKHRLEVDVVDLREEPRPDVRPYDAVLVGSGIQIGMWYGPAKRMLGRARGKRMAIFLASGRAGRPEEHAFAVERYLARVIRRKGLSPIAAEAFGGRADREGVVSLDNREPDRVRLWADEVGRKLETREQG